MVRNKAQYRRGVLRQASASLPRAATAKEPRLYERCGSCICLAISPACLAFADFDPGFALVRSAVRANAMRDVVLAAVFALDQMIQR